MEAIKTFDDLDYISETYTYSKSNIRIFKWVLYDVCRRLWKLDHIKTLFILTQNVCAEGKYASYLCDVR